MPIYSCTFTRCRYLLLSIVLLCLSKHMHIGTLVTSVSSDHRSRVPSCARPFWSAHSIYSLSTSCTRTIQDSELFFVCTTTLKLSSQRQYNYQIEVAEQHAIIRIPKFELYVERSRSRQPGYAHQDTARA